MNLNILECETGTSYVNMMMSEKEGNGGEAVMPNRSNDIDQL